MKKLGQHFLTSKNIAERIAGAADISSRDTILEIGPGKGALTRALLEKNPKKIIAVEKDTRLIPVLQALFGDKKKFSVIEGDIRELVQKNQLKKQLGTSYKVVANIPYYLTSYLIRILLENGLTKPKSIVFMVQKEVAFRIAQKPPHMNLLALSAQSAGDVRVAFTVPKKYFSPKPKVDSAVIVIDNISQKFFTRVDKKKFFALLHVGFSSKRKMLASNLIKKYSIPRSEIEHVFRACAIDTKARAENLSLKDWKCICAEI
ncbi:MAG: ribosomal RNA small subunit methyltransferase A [Candidatus Niyogibacteria bacterium CG10_big_fil_rev_8_21_14_0_10_46_36]|uniref:Ribosomal RNA small subunit methyltransferase A n=1 Tax=Candidatus Niyogibacteria bacterium CG10_big_fil_rev_8_21_14_0_10_46_36 TaxID=1974726 RepID=A0A2H0TDD6_9BACT|nr:MAG: ribosomal RNA small subunit methyltransferase A [Candidatus Niyogibacteria bacterium CG10_big_fil_rev_8_21_14_0_10_46_36]